MSQRTFEAAKLRCRFGQPKRGTTPFRWDGTDAGAIVKRDQFAGYVSPMATYIVTIKRSPGVKIIGYQQAKDRAVEMCVEAFMEELCGLPEAR